MFTASIFAQLNRALALEMVHRGELHLIRTDDRHVRLDTLLLVHESSNARSSRVE